MKKRGGKRKEVCVGHEEIDSVVSSITEAMASNQRLVYHLLHIFFIFPVGLIIGGSSSTLISDDALQCHGGLTGRNLLQAQSSCSVNFENQNYTILTSKCKGPNYPLTVCCEALKEFACPFTDEINDMKTDCASTMFSYINIYGRYPPGLFSNMCRGDKYGLTCNESNLRNNNAASTHKSSLPGLILITTTTSCLLILLFL